MNIGKFIKNHREKLNMTQKELAKTLSVSNITVCRWENNAIVPTEHNWVVLQNLFGIRNDSLKIPFGTKIKKIKPLNKLKKKSKRKKVYKNFKYPLAGLRDAIVKKRQSGVNVFDLAEEYKVSRQAIYNLLKKAEKQGEIIPWKTVKTRYCQVCNKEINHNNKTCSVECRNKKLRNNCIEKNKPWSKYLYVTLKCDKCSKTFERTKFRHMISMKSTKNIQNKKNYCCLECYRSRNLI